MSYINGFIAPVPTKDRDVYVAFARKAADFFKSHGALSVVEAWGHDVPDGKVTSLPMAVKKKDDETVVFSWIVWPSKAESDRAFEAMMSDPQFDPSNTPMPFDGQRVIYGGFDPLFEV
jgi:uncharacterized protein YbaA (DUF1428 family)